MSWDARTTCTTDGTNDIWVVSSRGGGARNLTPVDPGDDRNAAWPPDGRLIAFASNRTGNFEIFSMRANGKDPTQLTHSAATESIPDWQRLRRSPGR